MENTLENRARFFSLYYGVKKVLKITPTQNETIGKGGWNLRHPDFYLELKPLSSITDEDAIEVSTIWGSEVPSKIIGRSLVLRIAGASPKIETEFRNAIGVIDYLRFKGYALPFMGLSVEKMIEYGWIKTV